MNIILGTENLDDIGQRYTVLPLDKIRVKNTNNAIQSYCLIENLPISEMFQLDSWIDLHKNLMINYERQNWLYCLQAIEHLKGKWNGELDSFYVHLESRINDLKEKDLSSAWDPAVNV